MQETSELDHVRRPPPKRYTGPWYQGFVFVLVSSVGKANHTLTIATQWNEAFGPAAAIFGSWRGDDPSSQKPVEGIILNDGADIQCQWTTPNGTNVLTGTLTWNAGAFTPVSGLAWPSALLDGDVIAYDAQGNVISGAGPGHVSGTGMAPLVTI
jgi:hypothetical protein